MWKISVLIKLQSFNCDVIKSYQSARDVKWTYFVRSKLVRSSQEIKGIFRRLLDVLKIIFVIIWTLFKCNLNSWGRLLAPCSQTNILISCIKFHETFLRQIKHDRVWMKKNFRWKKISKGETSLQRTRKWQQERNES